MNLSVELGEISYPIIIEKGLLNKIKQEVCSIFKGSKIVIITDSNVNKFYGEKILSQLTSDNYEIFSIILNPGEETKNLNIATTIFNKLASLNINRSDLIIALGGGVIGDLAGFVASTYLRGIDFIQMPTSLLAQVDSSVGGKVAVDLDKGKNLVGAFYHPKKVLIDTEVLETLKDRYFRDGLAEVIKYGCIFDLEFFEFLYNLKDKEEVILNLEYIIYKCCELKKSVVEKDEKDNGERMLLNFGHTLGHAIEKHYDYKKYAHGEAVAIGMYEITKLSEEKNLTKEGTANKIKDILLKYNLPYKNDIPINSILETINLDKKILGKNINLILLDYIGKSKIYKTKLDFLWRNNVKVKNLSNKDKW